VCTVLTTRILLVLGKSSILSEKRLTQNTRIQCDLEHLNRQQKCELYDFEQCAQTERRDMQKRQCSDRKSLRAKNNTECQRLVLEDPRDPCTVSERGVVNM
jgi:hypothetical protein